MITSLLSDKNDSRELKLFDFSQSGDLNDWMIVNDGVMGGLSTSSFRLDKTSTAIFSGNVTTENNGGFASTRCKPKAFKLDEYKGIRLRVMGDGNTYQFRAYTENYADGVAYRHLFETLGGQWQTITIPFNECKPSFRGRILEDVDSIAPSDIQQVGLLIADGQTGSFKIKIKWISAYK